ncbi:MAG: flagellar hook-associated protein FlgK [Catonella sp.]|uniref:flagellar hook-associated protein FlgK n=1 Tax=Catonella sp. TaxID=2382125 RepID=UPI003FA11E36
MPSTFFGLDIGTSGLHTYQAALNTTFHNITNAKTEGYSRQQLNRQAKDPIAIAQRYGMVGTGVIGNKITQIRDEYYDLKYRTANTINGEYDSRAYYLKAIQNYMNEIKEGGFNTNFKNLFNGMSEVEKDPTSKSARAQMVNQAYALTEYFNNLSENLKNIQNEVNFNIKNTIDAINSYGDQIATLTKQINIIEVSGGYANDLRDQRNLIVDKLSKLANVTVKEERIGEGMSGSLSGVTHYTVKVNGGYLVNNYEANRIEAVPRTHVNNMNDVEGLYDLQWSDGQNFATHHNNLGGKLGALFQMRDGNNRGSLRCHVKEASAGDTELTLEDTNINSVENMNFPPKGKITVGSEEYEYTGFDVKVEKDPDTGKTKFKYTFKLKEDKPIQKDITEDDKVVAKIGEQVDFKGIPYYLDQLNNFIRKFSKEFNEIHKTGEDLEGNKGRDLFNSKDEVTGNNYIFKVPGTKDEDGNEIEEFSSEDETYYKMTAHNYSVTKEFKENPGLVAAASSIANGVENTDVMKKLENLQKDRTMFDQGKPEEFYQSLTSDIGVDTKTAATFSKNQNMIVKSIDNQRISISGVDTEEEAMNMVRFKNCYDLSAKIITVMNEIYNKLINEMAI